jgi:hypothetical protein
MIIIVVYVDDIIFGSNVDKLRKKLLKRCKVNSRCQC